MARVFDESHRDIIHERLVIWRGPPPSDLGKNDEMLLQLCSETGCQEVYIDSLKDATLKLSDEESTGGLNRAIQRCTVAGIQVVGLHHQRKRQSGGEKPKTLDDVYGNMQLTAGVGSVVLLWGAAGDSIVELVHLKQPAGEVGPWMLEHDHHIGRTTVFQGFDAFAFLKGRGKVGATATEAARAMVEKDAVTDNQRKKAQRLLEGLVRKGYADKTEPVIGGSGGSEGARYRYLDGGLISSSRAPDRAPDSGVQAQSTTAPPPSPDTDHEIPAQSNGHVIGHTVQTGAPDTTPLFKQGVGGSRPVPDYDLEEPF
jgi:replicative DNA helicase